MKRTIIQILPVLFGFFIMGFCDIVGIATSYVKFDFGLNETTAGLLPSMVFIWFLLLSMPTALMMNRYGRKRMVIISNIVTIVGMLLPFIEYNFTSCMGAFLLLGIGNTILQVSLNPLLTNVVKGNALASSLTAGQLIKAISSLCGPILAAYAATSLGRWQYVFPIFAGLTVLSTIWLQLTPIKEEPAEKKSSLIASLELLRDKTVLLLFFGIFFIVGTDVGVNTIAPKLLIERCEFSVVNAGYSSSVYFVCRTVGAFLGTIALVKTPAIRYFRINIIAALVSLLTLFFAWTPVFIMVGIGLIGFFCSSIFSVIYSQALEINEGRENELSGLMIMGIFGGAIIPPVMGLCSDVIGNQCGSLIVIGLSILYLTICSFALRKQR